FQKMRKHKFSIKQGWFIERLGLVRGAVSKQQGTFDEHTLLVRGAALLTAALLLLPFAATAQNGLRDIPDTAVEAQLKSFKLPEGAKINLFASEPLIEKPLHMNWDAKGRLWVVGSSMYPQIEPGAEENDKLFVIEDTDGDGVADKSTVFANDLYIPSSVLPGDGGVYIANSTEILFLKDTDGDGKADLRKVVLAGFGTEDTHHLVHTLRWGPEGMMWINQSIYIHTHIETPYGIRRLMGGGMWHFRPETGKAEVFMRGLVNPWGHAFDEWGQSFMTDGAGGNGINWVFPRGTWAATPGSARTLPGLNPGQPKHCGLEILSGKQVPEDYVGTMIAPDFRGHRVNRFKVTENGTSAYNSTQVEDLVSSSHRAFRPIDAKMGPDGAIYIADWYNPIIQHGEVDFRDPRRDHKHGRIWRVSFPGRDLEEKPEIEKADEAELVRLLNSNVGWVREQVIVEIRNRDPDKMETQLSSFGWAGNAKGYSKFLIRRLGALQAIGKPTDGLMEQLLSAEGIDPDPKARAAALRALYYAADSHEESKAIAEKAIADDHPRVRLWAVSVLAQLDDPDTVKIALRAFDGIEKPDVYLDFVVWNICREHKDKWLSQAEKTNPFESAKDLLFALRAVNSSIGGHQIFSALEKGEFKSDQEIADVADWAARTGTSLDPLFEFALADGRSPEQQITVLNALNDAAKLKKAVPQGDKTRLANFLKSENNGLFSAAANLAGPWKIEAARPDLEAAFLAAEKLPARADAALNGLRALGGPKTAQFLRKIASDDAASFQLRSLAVTGMIRMNPKVGAELAIPVLKSAPNGKDPHGIFDAILANKQGPPALVAELNKPENALPQEIALVGLQKASSAATKPQGLINAIQKAGNLKPMKMALTPPEMEAMMTLVAEKGDPHRGEKIYRRAALVCTACHAIGGAGGVIGPDLVSIGSSAPVDYLIDSLLQPSVKIKEGYHTVLVTLKNGDAFAGAIASETGDEIVIRDATGNENRIPKSEVAKKEISPVSLMPPGLTAQLREDEFVDLVRFMSELGKEGDFSTKPNRYVRHWKVLQPHERIRDEIGHYSEKIFAENDKTYVWTLLYSRVDGSLPTDDLPQQIGRGKNRYGVASFEIEVAAAGKVPLKIDAKLADTHLFIGEDKIELPKEGSQASIEIDVKKPGKHKITMAGLLNWGWDSVRVEIPSDATGVELVK
ncbi:HEAT repeat domain-containing protein, partial [Verrucomicrobiales bacterium]|nr:HEAT repeat domain-containing protein [Verrucomicrobiales bacterium]